MKNNSVKFKQNVPRSSTSSIISDFQQDCSPMANGFLMANTFSHAQTISARLSRSSKFNEQNLYQTAVNNKKLNITAKYIMEDEVLSKSPMGRLITNQLPEITTIAEETQNSKYTKNTLRRIQKLEKMIKDQEDKNVTSFQNNYDNQVEEEDPEVSESRYEKLKINVKKCEIEEEPQQEQEEVFFQRKISRRLTKTIESLRLFKKDPSYYSLYEGQHIISNPSHSNISMLKNNKDGCLINLGNALCSINLIGDTYKVEQICDNPEKGKYTSIFATDSHISDECILTGTDQGLLIGWNLVKMKFQYYAINDDLVQRIKSQPVFITQHLQNIYVGTQDNQVLILDPRLKEKTCLLVGQKNNNLYRADSICNSPFFPTHQICESPNPSKKIPMEFNEDKSMCQQEQEEILEPIIIPEQNKHGIRYIDAMDFNLLTTMHNGFIHFDIRNPLQAQFSFQDESVNAIKALYSPNNNENVILGDRNSDCLRVWNLDQEKLLYEKKLEQSIEDLVVSNITKELVTLNQKGVDSILTIYNNEQSKLKYIDELCCEKFKLNSIGLSDQSQQLYGFGAYSFRSWEYYNEREMKKATYQIQQYYKERQQGQQIID